MTIEAEQAVLGGIMLLNDPASEYVEKVTGMLRPSSFSNRDNQIIYRATLALLDKGHSVDPLTIGEVLKANNELTRDAEEYVVELAGNTPSAENIVSYAHIVRDGAIERYAVRKVNEALATLSDRAAGTIQQRLGLAESILTSIQERATKGQNGGLKHVRDIGKAWLPEMTDRVENGVQSGFTLGIDPLDRLLYPKRVPGGSLVVVGARPKMGKTGFLARVAEHYACEIKTGTAVFSLEMPNAQIYERLITGAAKVDPEMFYTPTREETDWSGVLAAAQRFNDSSLFIDDTPGVSLSHIRREARNLNRRHRVGLVAVDYLTLMEAGPADRNDLAYGAITKALKNLAKEMDCVVVLLTQLNRKLEERKDKRPMPSDSRDTGQIEQDCDLWIGLYREHAYDQSFPSESLTEAIVRLNRHGKTGTAYFDLINGAVQETDQQAAIQLATENQRASRAPTLNY